MAKRLVEVSEQDFRKIESLQMTDLRETKFVIAGALEKQQEEPKKVKPKPVRVKKKAKPKKVKQKKVKAKRVQINPKRVKVKKKAKTASKRSKKVKRKDKFDLSAHPKVFVTLGLVLAFLFLLIISAKSGSLSITANSIADWVLRV